MGLLYKACLVSCIWLTMARWYASRERVQNPGRIKSRCQSGQAWEALFGRVFLRRDGRELMGLVEIE
jgi:hypothetical protein